MSPPTTTSVSATHSSTEGFIAETEIEVQGRTVLRRIDLAIADITIHSRQPMHQWVDILCVGAQISSCRGSVVKDSFFLTHRLLNGLEAAGSYLQIVSHECSMNANGGEDIPLTLGKIPVTLGTELRACLSGGTKLSGRRDMAVLKSVLNKATATI
jgi:hypothetical protein